MSVCGWVCSDYFAKAIAAASDPEVARRFLSKVELSGECWVWVAGRFQSGYGAFYTGGKTRRAHRVSYELFTGSLPSAALITHHCDNPPCVNPEHLWAGTPQTNMDDKVARRRQAHVRGNRKLNEEQASEIRAALLGGERQSVLAAKYLVSQATISFIKSGTTWKPA